MDEKIIQNARNLRKNMTKQERILWKLLRRKSFYNLRFRRQYPLGKYIADFACLTKKVIIELDGGQHNQEENIKYDKLRTNYFESKGYKVIRIWNNDLDNNIDGVYLVLKNALNIEDSL